MNSKNPSPATWIFSFVPQVQHHFRAKSCFATSREHHFSFTRTQMNDVALRTNDVMLRINGELQFCTMTPTETTPNGVVFSLAPPPVPERSTLRAEGANKTRAVRLEVCPMVRCPKTCKHARGSHAKWRGFFVGSSCSTKRVLDEHLLFQRRLRR